MVAAALLTVSPAPSRAANLFWDPDTNASNNTLNQTGAPGASTFGGAGTWNTSATQWWNGTTDVAWSNAAYDTAWISGARLSNTTTFTLGANMVVGGLAFTTHNTAHAAGGFTLSLGDQTTPISVAAYAKGTLGGGILAANGFIKNGGGELVMATANTGITGTVVVNAGNLSFWGVNNAIGTTNKFELF